MGKPPVVKSDSMVLLRLRGEEAIRLWPIRQNRRKQKKHLTRDAFLYSRATRIRTWN